MQKMRPPDLPTLSDHELLVRFCDSNQEDAFRTIVERHKTMVSSVCTSVLRNHADAEDAFQAAFFILARKAKSLQGKDCIGGWLHRVALRCALATLRRKRKQRDVSVTRGKQSRQDELELVSTRAMNAALHEALDALPERYRLPLILCYIEGMSCKDAAGRLKLSEMALYKRLERGRQTLRHRLTAIGVASGSLLFIGAGASPAAACTISAAKVSSTIFVAMHAKLAWAKGALASAGNQASLTLAQGVMKTMTLTTLVKSACSVLAGACIGLVSMSAVAMAQSSTAHVDDAVAQVLQETGDVDQSSASETLIATTQAAGKSQQDRADYPKVIDATKGYYTFQGRQVQNPKVIDATRGYYTFRGRQVQDPKVTAATRGYYTFQGRQVQDPKVTAATRGYYTFQGRQVQNPKVIDATRGYYTFQGRAAENEADQIQQRLQEIQNELKKLSKQIQELRQSLDDRE